MTVEQCEARVNQILELLQRKGIKKGEREVLNQRLAEAMRALEAAAKEAANERA